MIDIGKIQGRLINKETEILIFRSIAEQLKRIADVQEEKLKILRAKGKN